MPTITAINEKITKLQASERITKAMLSELSRDLLEYVILDESMDIAAVNRTISVLTPMNKQTACLFFDAMLPFSFDEEHTSFTKLQKKLLDAKTGLIEEFLADETQDIWSWAADNIKIEAKKVDYLAKITKDVTKALADEEDNNSLTDVLAAVMASEEVDIASLMLAMEAINEPLDKAA